MQGNAHRWRLRAAPLCKRHRPLPKGLACRFFRAFLIQMQRKKGTFRLKITEKRGEMHGKRALFRLKITEKEEKTGPKASLVAP